jgi:hypothetical protein
MFGRRETQCKRKSKKGRESAKGKWSEEHSVRGGVVEDVGVRKEPNSLGSVGDGEEHGAGAGLLCRPSLCADEPQDRKDGKR